MSDNFVLGYALARQNGLPIVRTGSATERAAMVNALVAEYGHMVWQTATDADIKRDFERLKRYGDEIIPVKIERLPAMPNA